MAATWMHILSFCNAVIVFASGTNSGFECLYFEKDTQTTYADNDVPSHLGTIYVKDLFEPRRTDLEGLTEEAIIQECEDTCKNWGTKCTTLGCRQDEERCGKEKHDNDGTMAVAYSRCDQACGGFYFYHGDGRSLAKCEFRAVGVKQMAGGNAGGDALMHRCIFARANVHCPADKCMDGNNEGTLDPFTSTRWVGYPDCSQYVQDGHCDADAKECNHRFEEDAQVCNSDNEGHGQADQKCCACGGGSSGWGLFLETAGEYIEAGDECDMNAPVADTVSEGTCNDYASSIENPRWCLPGYEKIGRGFNILTEELRQRAVGLTYVNDGKIVLGTMSIDDRVVFENADQIDISDKTTSASAQASTTKIESMEAFYRNRDISLGGEGMYKGVTFGAKTSASQQVAKSLSQGKTLYVSRKKATFLTARLNAGTDRKPCSIDFAAELAKLARENPAGTFNTEKYNSLYKPLIDAFGTHFVYGGKMGGKVQEDRFESSCSQETEESVKLAFEGSASAATKKVPVSGEGSASQEQGSTQATSTSSKREGMVVTGGKNTDFSSKGWDEYQDSLLKNQPALIEFELRPIWKLATGIQRKMLHRAVAKYLKDELEGMEKDQTQLNQLCAITEDDDSCSGTGTMNTNSAPTSVRGNLAMPLALAATSAAAVLN